MNFKKLLKNDVINKQIVRVFFLNLKIGLKYIKMRFDLNIFYCTKLLQRDWAHVSMVRKN